MATGSEKENICTDVRLRKPENPNGGLTEYGSVTIETVQMKAEVGLIGGISLIAGTIIGSGIFISPKGVLEMSGSVGLSLIIWTASGVLALMGALCYSELGTLVRKSGGEYAYIKEAIGPVPAFLFAWTSVIVIRTSSIAIISLTFAEYTATFFTYCGVADIPIKLVAAAAIVTLMLLNSYSVSLTNKVQVLFTFAKLLALGIIVVGGIVRLIQGNTDQFNDSFNGSTTSPSTIALALYQALWAYDGWNNLNYVTEEIIQPEKNLPRANVFGVVMVTVVYVLTNISYLTAMTSQELLDSNAVAVTWGDRVLHGAAAILPASVLFSTFGAANGTMFSGGRSGVALGAATILPASVLFSTFGAANGIMFSGGRVVYVAGRDGHLPEFLSFVQVHRLTPLPSVVFTGCISMFMIGISNISSLVDFFSFTAWLFYGTAVFSLLVMRYTKRDEKRIIKVPIGIPIVFVLCAIYLVIAPIIDDPRIEFLYAAIFVVSGLVFYVPLVHFKLIRLDKLTTYVQLLLQVAPSPYVPEN